MISRDQVPRFFDALKRSIESSPFLGRGKAFEPAHLKGWKLSKSFRKVMRPLAKRMGLPFHEEISNGFPTVYQCGHRQIVDYVLGSLEEPVFYCELETLDRAQLYLFWDPPGLAKRESPSKLWHYYVTLAKARQGQPRSPRYFVWLLALPDYPVARYQVWDFDRGYGFFQPKFRKPFQHLIKQSPYRFYDPLIKLAAREFLTRRNEDVWFRLADDSDWERKWIAPASLQRKCELVFVTITGHHLILSRGRDLFDAAKETRVRLRWK
jgi:hypothetical protein